MPTNPNEISNAYQRGYADAATEAEGMIRLHKEKAKQAFTGGFVMGFVFAFVLALLTL